MDIIIYVKYVVKKGLKNIIQKIRIIIKRLQESGLIKEK